jgi:hypothetical protein
MRDADGVAQDSHLYFAVVIGTDAAKERYELVALGELVCSFGVYRLFNQVNVYSIIPHLRCVAIPHPTPEDKDFPASEICDNPSPSCGPWRMQSVRPCSNEARRVSGRPMARFLTEKLSIPTSPKWTALPCNDATDE